MFLLLFSIAFGATVPTVPYCTYLFGGFAVERNVTAPLIPIVTTERLMMGTYTLVPVPNPYRVDIWSRELKKDIGVFYITWQGNVILNFGITINPEHQGKGFGSEAKYAFLKYAFEKLDATEVYDNVPRENIASLKLHLKLGYTIQSDQDKHRNIDIKLTRENFQKMEAEWRQKPDPRLFFFPQN